MSIGMKVLNTLEEDGFKILERNNPYFLIGAGQRERIAALIERESGVTELAQALEDVMKHHTSGQDEIDSRHRAMAALKKYRQSNIPTQDELEQYAKKYKEDVKS